MNSRALTCPIARHFVRHQTAVSGPPRCGHFARTVRVSSIHRSYRQQRSNHHRSAVRTAMKRLLAFKRDLSQLMIYGHFEMAEIRHAEEAHRHMAIDVDGDVDVTGLGCANTYRLQHRNRDPDRSPGG